MADSPGLAERAIWMLPDREICPDNTGLYISMVCGVLRIEEKDPDIRLCLHYKHFLPGEFIQDNIMRAAKCSKRTVLVLSRNFLESEWCLLEFKLAHVQALKGHVPRIIIIKLADLPKDDELPEEIQLYLKNTTYLNWGEKHFWNKLLYTLPRSQSVQKHKSREDASLQIPMANLFA
ncbi:protein toll [Caerostris darwini]|uniref:Protein toll n=1 Tax=Caerostris darwini TaxID=1538125 RepID=A0AAV4SBV4_9ARAC|nr:protein toll [Caerostris darwini]